MEFQIAKHKKSYKLIATYEKISEILENIDVVGELSFNMLNLSGMETLEANYFDETIIFISNLEIEEGYRLKGLGAKLLKGSLIDLRRLYPNRNICCLVPFDNIPMINLLNKFSFRNCGKFEINDKPTYLFSFLKNIDADGLMLSFKDFIGTSDQKALNKMLTEDTRTMLVSKSRSVGNYKNNIRGKNRFERKKFSKISKSVKQYNKINMNDFFKSDMLVVSIPVEGETDNYTVTVKMDGVLAEIQKNIKNNNNKFEFRTVVQALTKVFNTTNIYVKCTCDDYKYNYAHWNIINKVSVDDTSKDPGPGKGIQNPNDTKGRGCKHVLLVLANGDWIMKVASVINNYVHYAEEHLQKPFLKIIFPKLYGIPAEEAVEEDLIDDDKYLDSTPGFIDAINEYGKNRGKIKKGSNKNPVAEKEKESNKKETDKQEAEENKND